MVLAIIKPTLEKDKLSQLASRVAGHLEVNDGHVALRNNPHPSGAAVAVEHLLDVVADVLVLHVRVAV